MRLFGTVAAFSIDFALFPDIIASMFLAVIMGYVVSAVFLFCGIANTVIYLQGLNPSMTAPDFVNGLALAMWPLAIAAVIYILTQMAILIERQCIITENPPLAQSPALPKGKSTRPAAPSTPAPLPKAPFFPASHPAASSNQQAKSIPTSLKEAAAAAAIAAADTSAAAWENKGNHTASPQGSDEKRQEDLQFFRID